MMSWNFKVCFLNIGGFYFSKFLFEAKINTILADVKTLRKYFNGG